MRLVRKAALICVSGLIITGLGAQEGNQLPVRKVVLYKNGIGYFEHVGPVKGSQGVEIALPSAQLNDVLKSLTVLDLGGGQVAGVGYDSTAPLDQRLAELPVNPETAGGLVDLLNQFRGTGVEIRAPGGVIAGKLVGAEKRIRSSGPGLSSEFVQLSVFAPTGEVRVVELESVGGLKLTDPGLSTELGRYLDLLNTRYQRDIRRLRIQTAGSGERQLYVSYTSESPIWKTTYRIVLDPKQKPLLQGWAIVDNTTPNDWLNVALSLVAGAPVSFIQHISQPVYGRRPVVPLPQGVQVTPQVHEASLFPSGGPAGISGRVIDPSGAAVPGAKVTVVDEDGAEVAQGVTGADGRYSIVVAPGRYEVKADMPGFRSSVRGGVNVGLDRFVSQDFRLAVGAVSEAVLVDEESRERSGLRPQKDRKPMALAAALPGPAPAPSFEVAEAMRRQAVPTAAAQALAEQFEYKLRQPVTIRRNESALLPVVNAEIGGEKVSLMSAGSNERHPRLAFWLKNTSGLTLDGGSVTVIDTNAFAGEGLIETIQPGENRLLSYAVDLAAEISSATGSERQRVERVVINHGVLRMQSKLLEKRTFTVRNNDEKPRTVIIEHPVRSGWKLVETAAPAESSASAYRFRVEARPKATTELTVKEESPQEVTYAVTNVTPDQIALWVRDRQIDPETEKSLSPILAKKNELSEIGQRIAALDREQQEIFRDQERVRGNLQRLGQSPDEASLRQRYVRQLDQQENRLAAIRAEREKLDASRTAAQKHLDEMIQNLAVDRKL